MKPTFNANLTRRNFLVGGCQVFLGSCFGFQALARPVDKDPHFCLHLFFPGGMDATYTFDARPLAMTQAKLQTNYHGKEPVKVVGSNGTNTWRTTLVDPLKPYLNRFSIINGVIMTPDFQGHEDSQSITFTGNPFGGPSYFEAFQTLLDEPPITAMRLGVPMVGDPRIQTSGVLPLDRNSTKNMVMRSKDITTLNANTRIQNFIKGRLQPQQHDIGSYGRTKQLLSEAFGKIPALSSTMQDIKIDDSDKPQTPVESVKLALNLFKAGLSNNALCVFDTDLSENQDLDCHDLSGAKDHPRIVGELMTELAAIFNVLETTAYDNQRSYFDVTTVIVSTEFGRTMRQGYFDESGTDHNPYTNTFLLGGKGIKGGLVLGESDFASVEEKSKLSGAHLQLDPIAYNVVGRPFDFATFEPRTDKPNEFKLGDYLTCGSVINTVLACFNVDTKHWRTPVRNTPPFLALRPLLT
ncbi:MAG: DUF1501 domain-containing protein [Oligoflexales bacterium]